MGFTWTAKRKSALEHLIQSQGNVRIAAEASQRSPFPVSEHYINSLKYRPEFKPFRDEYRQRTSVLLDAMEVDSRYVIEGLVELSKPGIKPVHVRLQALKALGDFRGIWAPEKHEYREIEDWEYTHEWGDATPEPQDQPT